jgi:hypothetical protein
MECYLHGNLPVQQGSPFAEESEVVVTEFVAKQPKIAEPFRVGTGIRVDANGRRSLVNDIR